MKKNQIFHNHLSKYRRSGAHKKLDLTQAKLLTLESKYRRSGAHKKRNKMVKTKALCRLNTAEAVRIRNSLYVDSL